MIHLTSSQIYASFFVSGKLSYQKGLITRILIVFCTERDCCSLYFRFQLFNPVISGSWTLVYLQGAEDLFRIAIVNTTYTQSIVL